MKIQEDQNRQIMSLLKEQMSLQREQNDLLKQLIVGRAKDPLAEIGLNSVQKMMHLTSGARAVEGSIVEDAIVEGTVFGDKASESIDAEDATGVILETVPDDPFVFDNAYKPDDTTVVQASNLAPTQPSSNKNTIN